MGFAVSTVAIFRIATRIFLSLALLLVTSQYAHASVFGLFSGSADAADIHETPALSSYPTPFVSARDFPPEEEEDARERVSSLASSFLDETSMLPIVPDMEGNDGERDFILTYKIKEGDTLLSIAEQFDLSVNTILWANNLENKNRIKIGQELVILPINGISYKVKKGDTLESIAKIYKADKTKILEFNDITTFIAGDEILIPDGVMPASVASKAVTTRAISSSKVAPAAGKLRLLSFYATLPDLSDFFKEPVVGRISQHFHGKNGVDIASPCGTPMKAAAPGVVTIANDYGWNGGYGKLVVIKHNNGTQTLYAHLSKVYVKAGSTVSYETKIGLVGTTGRSTGCHLHFETRGAKNLYLTNSLTYGR